MPDAPVDQDPDLPPGPEPGPEPGPAPGGSLAERLDAAAAALSGEQVPVQALAQAHGPVVGASQAALGSLLVLLALPCLLPVAGVGTVLGLGLVALSWALWRGDAAASLPPRVAGWPLPRATAQRLLRALARLYRLAERWSREGRWLRPAGLAGERPHGWLGAKAGLMALLIVLPIPLGNLLPALSLLLLGLGLALRDGLAVLLSTTVAGAALAFTGALGWLGWQHGLALLQSLWPV